MKPSIGQYIPGNSILHKSDPRTKLVMTVLYMVAVMFIDTFLGYGVATLFLIISVIASRIPVKMVLKSLKPLVFIVAFTVLLNIFFQKGETLLLSVWIIEIYLEGILFAVKMAIRIIILVAGASLLTFTTSSISLTDGLERLMSPLAVIRFPAHDIAMMMSIALRFIPTFTEETDRIMKAQSSRGAEFDTGSFMQKIKSFIPVIIPLIISAFRRAEDLAVAMESRCYRGGKGRTRFRMLKFSWCDAVISCFMIAFFAVIIIFKL
ncbi:MAG: energy-coupling factor transporter transmembrane protein EcfT [Ruminococcaceae bacterium]|nr:energy-coupling factor transporter transmembrane protein EcfT [Oscillospiraceae bacterium]